MPQLTNVGISDQGLRELEIFLGKDLKWTPWVYFGTYLTDKDATPRSPRFQNGWRNQGSGKQRLRFRRTVPTKGRKLNSLEIEGQITGGIAGTLVGTLPATFRPKETALLMGPTDDPGVAIFQLDTNGDLTYLGEATSSASGAAGGVLDGTYPNPGLAASVAGAGLAETSDVLSVNADGSTIEISSDTLRIKDAGVTEAKLGFSDVTTDNVTSTKHGLAPKSPADATNFLNGATTPAYAQVKDSDLSTSDVTTNNVTTSKHGFAPKLPNDPTKYLDGTGAYTVPAGGGGGGITKLYDYTVSGSDKASIDTNVDGTTVADFSGYSILTWYVIARTDAAGVNGTLDITLNNDTGSKYDYQEIVSNNTTTSSGAGQGLTVWSYFVHGSGGGANYASLLTFVCAGYADTTFYKNIRFDIADNDSTNANQRLEVNALAFKDTAAITRIKVFGHSSEKLKVGSRLIVYGQ